MVSAVSVPFPLSAQAPDPSEEANEEQEAGVESETPSDRLIPPRLSRSVDPVYPPERAGEGLHPTVLVDVTINDEGQVVEAHVEHSAGEDFDQAAIAAVEQWEFIPALRGKRAVASRVRVAVHFELPAFDLVTAPDVVPQPLPEVHVHDAAPAAPATVEEPASSSPTEFSADATIDPHLRTQERGASDFTIEREVLEAAPRIEGAEVLRTAPGVFIARAGGDAIAHRITLRGFDAEHGQDLELRVGGLPINMPSHLHGQGYADLGFLIAEVVHEMHVTEGVYDPRQGDFAVAGSIDIELGVEERGWRLKSGYGSFNTFRQLAVWAPEQAHRETFGAFQYRQTDGFGQNRRSQVASAIMQSRFGSGTWQYRVIGIAYGARADTAGVLRVEDIEAGEVGFYDVYPFATARGQNGLSTRVLFGFTAEYRGSDGDNGELGAWLSYDHFRLQQNFTGFIERSQSLAGVSGRGDLIEQQNRTASIGLNARYRTAPYEPWDRVSGTLEFGISTRLDVIQQEQNLIDAAVRNQTWDERVDAGVRGADLGFWGDLDWQFTEYLKLRFGMRADVLFYEVDDRLGNFVPLTRPDDQFIVGFRRSASGVAWGPRTSAEVRPRDWMAFRVAYGEGYRSPQARTLEDGERAPFTKVRSSDVGIRFSKSEVFQVTLAGYWTRLSDDVAFEAREGRLERVGATRRLGFVLHAQTRPLHWLTGAFSLTFVDAELLEPPPPTAEEPQPAFESGQNLPFVPPVVIRADVGAHGPLRKDLGAHDLEARMGLGFSYLSPRPLPFGEFADPVSLLDVSAGVSWGPLTFGVEVFNLLDDRYAAVEFNFTSNWDPSSPPSRVPARHIAAGAPRTFMATLEVQL